ncbi:type I restriction enzyme S subunit [Sulfitobacter undariae]|uniref:Type I restriction enzyme S subunit n=1 Tax=Sulfitobacter undariae TaxID=1563671 RepID=A0A7W6E510_9RHOB|nr:restriction endonuclease subunit S [Sulfitobacter undariae]MBB3994881.1 type I restriction enzyme S subunit [Sulfitobacter undariae]
MVKAGYKQTEVGVIPEDWDVLTLNGIANIATGSTPPTHDRTLYGDEHLFVSPTDLGRVKNVTTSLKMLSSKGFRSSRRFPEGSTLFVCIGSTIGKTGLAKVELTSNQQINAVFPSNALVSEFTYQMLTYRAPTITLGASEQALPMINKSEFGKTKVSVPTINEQKAIAGALSDVDGLIAGLEALIAKKRSLKTATMQQLLTGKTRLPGFGEGVGMKQTELGEIPEDWEVFNFGDHFIIFAGGDVPKHSVSQIRSEKHPHPIFANAIQHEGIYGYTAEKRSEGDAVTITARGFLGHAEYRIAPFFPIVRLLVLEPCGGLDAKFSTYAINEGVEFTIESTGVPQLTAPQVKKYSLFGPKDKNEQVAIAETLADFDVLITALASKLSKTKALKQGMMQELLTGRTRLI